MKYLVRVGAIIIDDNRLLIDRNKTSPIFLLPGGIVEDETNEGALERELFEELNVKLKSSKKFKTYRFSKALFHDSPLKSVTYLTEIEGKPSPGSEILEIAWLGKNEYKGRKYNLAPLIRKVVPDLVESGYLQFLF